MEQRPDHALGVKRDWLCDASNLTKQARSKARGFLAAGSPDLNPIDRSNQHHPYGRLHTPDTSELFCFWVSYLDRQISCECTPPGSHISGVKRMPRICFRDANEKRSTTCSERVQALMPLIQANMRRRYLLSLAPSPLSNACCCTQHAFFSGRLAAVEIDDCHLPLLFVFFCANIVSAQGSGCKSTALQHVRLHAVHF